MSARGSSASPDPDRAPRNAATVALSVLCLLAAGWAVWSGRSHALEPPRAAPASQTVRLDLNSATAAQLESLPGIGPRRAEDIVADRAARGPFESVDDLDRVPGIGPRTLERLRPFVVVASPDPSRAPSR